jgi:hypothetical protein
MLELFFDRNRRDGLLSGMWFRDGEAGIYAWKMLELFFDRNRRDDLLSGMWLRDGEAVIEPDASCRTAGVSNKA